MLTRCAKRAGVQDEVVVFRGGADVGGGRLLEQPIRWQYAIAHPIDIVSTRDHSDASGDAGNSCTGRKVPQWALPARAIRRRRGRPGRRQQRARCSLSAPHDPKTYRVKDRSTRLDNSLAIRLKIYGTRRAELSRRPAARPTSFDGPNDFDFGIDLQRSGLHRHRRPDRTT